MWSPGQWSEITKGAVMKFENENEMTVDGLAGPAVWRALLGYVIAGKHLSSGYSYVYVHREVPETMTLWHNGQTVITSPANTGISGAETELGTFAVFEHLPETTMSRHKPRRLALRRCRDQVGQLLQRRRRAAQLRPLLLRHPPEPRLRRAPARGLRGDLALHADRHARHDRNLRLAATGDRRRSFRDQPGYSSLRQVRGSSGWAFGVRSSRKLKYGATNGSGAVTV